MMPKEKRQKPKSNTKSIDIKLKSSSQNFEEVIEKQLYDDFEVHQYLNKNVIEGQNALMCSSFNTDEYISLFNKLLAAKMKKKKKKDFLQSTSKTSSSKTKSFYNSSESKINKNSSTSMWKQTKKTDDGDPYCTEEQYEKIKVQSEIQQQKIETKIKGQFEIQRILWKQIMDNKKSLNLMKGDIGHLIARNQSIKTLQSKMNKVSLVATDQLKRVLLAFTKDKDQIRLRDEMQRNFHTKLKGMENLEQSNVKRLKGNYIESMKRKKEVFQKLNLIQKECASIDEFSDKKRMKNIKNARSLAILELLKKLCELIDSVPIINEKFDEKKLSIKDFSSQLKCISEAKFIDRDEKARKFSKNKIDLFNNNCLPDFEKKIILQYQNLQKEVQNRTNLSNELIKRLEELWNSLNNSENMREQLFKEMNEEERSQLTLPFSYKTYFGKLKEFTHNLRPIYLLIQFISNKLTESSITQYVTALNQNSSKFIKFTQWSSQFLDINEAVFENLAEELNLNLKFIGYKIENNEYFYVNNEKQRQNRKSRQNKTDSSYLTHMENHPEEQEINEIYERKRMSSKIEKKNGKEKKEGQEGAKRIQLLQKIDHSYYKMIKSTLAMEKDNTRKNYEFLKTFKRTKYSTQDQLLQEKRFQASFSGLFSEQNVSRGNYSPKDTGFTKNISSIRAETEKKQKLSYHFTGKRQPDSLFTLTAPGDRSKLKKNLTRTSLMKKTKISSKVRQILQQS